MVVTGGPWPSDRRPNWRAMTAQLRGRGVDIYSIGVGRSVDVQDLSRMASTMASSLRSNSYSTLKTVIPRLVHAITKGIGTRCMSIFLLQWPERLSQQTLYQNLRSRSGIA